MPEKIDTKKIIEIRKPKLKVPIIKELRSRFSPRFFSTEHINNKILSSMFEAARWAPSAYNHQPWFFYWTCQDNVAYKKICSCFLKQNQWAKTAPVFIVACYEKRCEHGINKYAQYDLGSAVMSMIVQAQSLGIYARQMGLFNVKKLQKLLSISQKHTPFIILAVGKIGDYRKIDQDLLKWELQKRKRKESIAKQKN